METEKPITRIKLFAKLNKLSIKKFEEACGLKPNVIQNAVNRKSSMSDVTLGQIKVAFPNLNLTWVLLGKEEMLLTDISTINNKMGQDPDYKEVVEIIGRIDDEMVARPLRDRLFQLYQNNSDLKSELLRVYKIIGNL